MSHKDVVRITKYSHKIINQCFCQVFGLFHVNTWDVHRIMSWIFFILQLGFWMACTWVINRDLSNVYFNIVQVESSTLCLWLTGILTLKILFILEFWPPKLGSRWTKLHFYASLSENGEELPTCWYQIWILLQKVTLDMYFQSCGVPLQIYGPLNIIHTMPRFWRRPPFLPSFHKVQTSQVKINTLQLVVCGG